MRASVSPNRTPPRVLCATSEMWMSMAEVPRLLHGAGAHVTFLGPHDAWPTRGSFVARAIAVEGDAPAVAQALHEHLQATAPYDWIVVCDDLLLAALAARRHEPWVRAVLPFEPDDLHAGLLGSKVGFVRAAAALGLPIPWSRVCQGAEEIRAAMSERGAPVLIKEDGLSGGIGCHLLEDIDAVSSLPPRALSSPVVVQAFVKGTTCGIEALYDRGHLRSVLTSYLVRAWPEPFGASAVRRFVHHPGLVELAQDIGQKVGLHGFGNITVMEDRARAQLTLIELDPRPNVAFQLGEALGVPMIQTLREMLEHRPPVGPVRQLAPTVDIEVPMFPWDVMRGALTLDLKCLMAWAFNQDGRWRFVPRGDPRMNAAYGRHIMRQLVRHALPSRLRLPLRNAWNRLSARA